MGGLSFPDLEGGRGLSFLALGFPNLVHVGGGGSEFPEVRSGNPLYKPFTRYVLPQRAGFLRHFGLKTRMVLKGIYNMRVYECIYNLNSK